MELILEKDWTVITVEMLLDNGFKDTTSKFELDYYTSIGEILYSVYTLWTKDDKPVKIDMMHCLTNSGAKWLMHIDNEVCNSIGSCDIDYIWQFNAMLEILNSKFRL